jgi:hypothetical protein
MKLNPALDALIAELTGCRKHGHTSEVDHV